MRDVSELRLLCSAFCKPYQSEAKFYVEETNPSGSRQLVVIYEKGGYGGGKEFVAGIPKAWTDQDVENLILWPMKDPKALLTTGKQKPMETLNGDLVEVGGEKEI
jgi:hypothetical protein